METQTISLDTLMARGPIPAAQALRHAVNIAAAMRSLHESGQTCGVLDPSRITLEAGQAIIGPGEGDGTAYTAPERLAGARPNVRTDIYAFGALVYHMLSGRHPFPCDSAAGAANTDPDCRPAPLDPPVPGDLAEFETVIFRCPEKSPDRRWQSMRLICIELRLLSAAAVRLQPAAAPAPAENRMREEVSRMEARIAASEQAVLDLREAMTENRDYFRTAFEFVEDRLRSQAVALDRLQTSARQTDDVLERVAGSIAACDRAVAEARRGSEGTAEAVSAAIEQVESRLKMQAESIETLQAIAGQTDSLLERVVESIDSLQSFVLERTGALQS
jgi:hypothetical protein